MSYSFYEDSRRYKDGYEEFIRTNKVDTSILEPCYLEIREFVVNKYQQLKQDGYKDYKLDIELALAFYDFITSKDEFDPIVEPNYDFWRFLAIFVFPDVVKDRFGTTSDLHYFKPGRIYSYVLYWYVHLTWQGSIETTRELLLYLNTDDIVHFCERPTRFGINIELFRALARGFKEYIIKNKTKSYTLMNGKKESIVRILFKVNTAKLMVSRPEIYPGGVEGYVKMLFKTLGVTL